MGGSSAGPTALGRVGQGVADHVERVTRFDAAALQAQGPEQPLQAALALQLRQTVHFQVLEQGGVSRLPQGVNAVDGRGAMDAALEAERQFAEREAPAALLAWAQADAGSYRRLLPTNAAFSRAPRSYGFEATCDTCAGRCDVQCTHCRGAGRSDCPRCHRSGRINCPRCAGQCRVSCTQCSGRGTWTEWVNESQWDSSRNTQVNQPKRVDHSCLYCHGKGQVRCEGCYEKGTVTCSDCSGQGETSCHTCSGKGRVACTTCGASGLLHRWGCVQAQVAHDEQLQVDCPDSGLAVLLQERVDRAELPVLGRLLDTRHEAAGVSLRSVYRIHMDALRADLTTAGRAFVFYGLGPAAKVVHFGNVAGHLLSGDLKELEGELAAGSRWRPASGGRLLETARHFVTSELNLAIAEQVADLQGGPAAAAHKVEQSFAGLVDADYVQRAVEALREAFGRLYAATLLGPTLLLVGGVALVCALLYAALGPGTRAVAVAAAVGGVGLVLWLVLEWLQRRRLQQSFPEAVARRVASQLHAGGTVSRWRGGVLGTLLLAGAGLSAGVSQIGWVQQLHTQRVADAQLDTALAGWAQQPMPDLRLRSYPRADLLQKRAAAGDPQATLVLVWRHLSARAVQPDLQAVESLLQSSPAAREPLGRVARAALVALRPGNPPEVVRQAAFDVGNVAGLVEARYWEGLLYLADSSPQRDPGTGLRKLADAADRGHAHAALLLGTRLADGVDTKRDPARARRYLTQAQRSGLAEAGAALKVLR